MVDPWGHLRSNQSVIHDPVTINPETANQKQHWLITGVVFDCGNFRREKSKMVDLEKLAKKLDGFMEEYDPYNYMDCGYSLEQAKSDLVEMPYDIIDQLIDMANELMEAYRSEGRTA